MNIYCKWDGSQMLGENLTANKMHDASTMGATTVYNLVTILFIDNRQWHDHGWLRQVELKKMFRVGQKFLVSVRSLSFFKETNIDHIVYFWLSVLHLFSCHT